MYQLPMGAIPGKSAVEISTPEHSSYDREKARGKRKRTKFPVLGVQDVGGILRHGRAEERSEDHVCVGQLNVGEDTEGSLCRRCLTKGPTVGSVSSV